MDLWKKGITLSILIITIISFLPLYLFNTNPDNSFSDDYTISNKPEKKIQVLFNSYHPLEATIRRASNYQNLYDVTDVVRDQDDWVVMYNKRYVVNVKWDEDLYDGDIILFYGRLLGSCPERKILLTAPNDPSIIYGEYEFDDSSSQWFNITLDILDEINEFDIVIHYSCKSRIKFVLDYVSFTRGHSQAYWRDESGSIITKYQISFDYQINTTNKVDPSTIRLEIEANASIVTPAGTNWIPNHGMFYELFPTDPFIIQTWSSRWVALPVYNPSFCMWNITEYGDSDYSQCMYRTKMNITVNVIVRAYGKLFNGTNYVIDVEIESNIRNYPIFWY